MDLYRERLVSTNASEVEEISVEVRNTSDHGHFCFRSDILLLIKSYYYYYYYYYYNFLLQLSLFL